MNLGSVLAEDLCCILNENTKNENLFTLINLITKKLSLDGEDKESLSKDIFFREQLMSTGIGLGIGIPHIRFAGVSEPILAVGICKAGIPDYESIDDELIKIVIMIIVGKDQHKDHIRLLSLVVSMFKNTDVKTQLLNAANSREIYKIITKQGKDTDAQ